MILYVCKCGYVGVRVRACVCVSVSVCVCLCVCGALKLYYLKYVYCSINVTVFPSSWTKV